MNNIVLLSNTKYDGVLNLPIFDIEFLDLNLDISEYDALIFTSKNAIYSLENSKLKWRQLESYAIAPKTAKVLKVFNSNIVFIGEKSHGDEFAYELIPLLKNKKVLYVRGEKSVSTLTKVLKDNQINVKELISYKTVCSKSSKVELKSNSIIIFTSPSSIECFFKNYKWETNFKAIAIGNTTAKYLPQDIEFYVSDIQSIESCILLAKQISQN